MRLLLVVLTLAALANHPAHAGGDAGGLDGYWALLSSVGDLGEMPASGKEHLKINRGKFEKTGPFGGTERGTVVLGVAGELNTIDLRFDRVVGPGDGGVLRGIYRLKNGRLTIVWAGRVNAIRPTSFPGPGELRFGTQVYAPVRFKRE